MCRNIKCVQVCYILINITFLFQLIECKFEETNDNSSTYPSIEINLSPPENPLPEISNQIHLAETTREEIEDGLTTKLKDTFNEKLVKSQNMIKECVDQNFQEFFNSNKFKLLMNSLYYPNSHKNISHGTHPSFLQLYNNIKKSDVIHSSVRVMMDESEDLDPIVNQKIKQIEQLRNDLEIQLFEKAEKEFDELLQITLIELEKNIKIQTDALFSNTTHNRNYENIHSLEKKYKMKKLGPKVLRKQNSKNSESSNFFNKVNRLFKPSFLQLPSSSVQQKLLNVKFGQSDKPYPTVDDLVMNMEKRRDASEKKIRNEILDLQMKFVKAHHEMIKDALHTTTTKLLSKLGKSETVKT